MSTIPAAKMVTSAPDAVAAAHARLLKDSDLQFQFGSFVPPKMPDWLETVARFLVKIAPLLKVAFWCAVAGIALLILYFVGREIWMRYGWPDASRVKPESETTPWRPTRQEAELLLSDADALALSGKFGEAVHLILLRSVQDIARHRPAAVKPAQTSREIARLGALPESARGAFATIMRVVERSLFGGSPVSVDDFRTCRAEYERFAFPDVWAGRAAR